MQTAICEELIKEDTFNLFTQDIINFMHKDDIKSIKDIKSAFKDLFTKKLIQSKEYSLLYYESIRMLTWLDNAIQRFDDMYNDHAEDDNDLVVKMYCESLNEFVKNVNDPDVLNYVDSINK